MATIKPIVTVLSVITSKDRIILIRRKKPPYRGLWGLPGGKVKFSENIREAVLREAMEETGLDCRFDYVGCLASEVVYTNEKPKYHFLILTCVLHPISFKMKKSSEGAINWFSLRELPKPRTMIPSDRIFIRASMEKSNRICPFYEVEVAVTPEGKLRAKVV